MTVKDICNAGEYQGLELNFFNPNKYHPQIGEDFVFIYAKSPTNGAFRFKVQKDLELSDVHDRIYKHIADRIAGVIKPDFKPYIIIT